MVKICIGLGKVDNVSKMNIIILFQTKVLVIPAAFCSKCHV